MKEKQDYKKILHDAGLKSTVSRLAILEALSSIKRPETAQVINRKLKKNKIDLVTLYRTLDSFEKSGLLRKVNFQQDAVYYELNTNHHHHIVCLQCNDVEDFENSEIEKVMGKIGKNSFKFRKIRDHSIELFGLCKTCA